MFALLVALAVAVVAAVGTVGVAAWSRRRVERLPVEPDVFGWPVAVDESSVAPYRRGPSSVAGVLTGRR